MCSTNWALQSINTDFNGVELTMKRIAFMNAGRYCQDTKVFHTSAHVGACRRNAMCNKLAYHAKRYAMAVQEFVCCNIEASIRNKMLAFRWTRVDTAVVSGEGQPLSLCEYATHCALDDCIIAWCTTVALQLTLRQYDEAAASANLMSMMLTMVRCPWQPFVNAFSPPVLDIPCAIFLVIRDALVLLKNASTDDFQDSSICRTHHAYTSRLHACFVRTSNISSAQIPCYVQHLAKHCANVTKDCALFMFTRALLLVPPLDREERDYVCRRLPDMQGCADFVVGERGKLEIALFNQVLPRPAPGNSGPVPI